MDPRFDVVVAGLADEIDSVRRHLQEFGRMFGGGDSEGGESADSFANMVCLANSIILRLDPEGNVLYQNRYAERFFGFSSGELIGRNVVGTIVPERESTGRDLRALIMSLAHEPDRFSNHENENMTRDGKRVWISWTNRTIVDPDGNPAEIISVGNDITDRRWTETALRRNERKYRILFQASRDPIAVVSPEGRILDVNQAGLELFGYSREQMNALRVDELCESPEAYRSILDRLVQFGSVRNLEVKLRTGTGALLDCLLTIAGRVKGGDGLRYFQVFVHDMTERKRVEDALRVSERKLSIVVDAVPDIIYRINAEGKITYISNAVRNYGYSPDELIGRKMEDLIHPDDLGRVRKSLIERRTGGRRTRSLEIRLLNRNREIIPFEIHAGRVSLDPVFLLEVEGLYQGNRIAPENYLGAQGVARDITDRKRAEQAIRESEERFKALFESDREAVILIDETTGKVVDVNASGTDIYGYTRDEFLLLTRKDLWEERDAAANGEVQPTVLPFQHHRRKDGTVFPAEISGSTIDIFGHRLFLCVVRDITDRLRAEEEAMLREKFQGALEMAHAVCHEINQPLQVLSGYAEILNRETLDQNVIRDHLREIEGAVRRMAEITRKLSSITRYESFDYSPQKKIFDIHRASDG